jgi:hypothetical protein
MPLWDSVHRGLEKASQEAARIARAQRLRSTSDGVERQIRAQHEMLLQKTMELFARGQLTQPELSVICQELLQLQQQLGQIQAELKQLQANAPQSSSPQEGNITAMQPGAAPISPYQTGMQEEMETVLAPPPPGYQSYLDSTEAVSVPPPPPDIMPVNTENVAQALRCPVCQSEIEPHHAFCQQCGAPIQSSPHVQQATMRGNRFDVPPPATEEQATIRAQAPLPLPQQPPSPAEEHENRN